MKKYDNVRKLIAALHKPKRVRHHDGQAVATIVNDKTPFIIREGYKTARTNIIFSVSGINKSGCKIIAVTSANPGEGKTTSTLNLAITFAQTGGRVLAIDGDLRKPRLHRYLGLKKDVGLSSVLSQQVTIDKAIIKNARPGLDILPSGELPPNPAELLSSDAMMNILEQISGDYDYIFFDTPPVTVVTDAVALSPLVDGVMVVVRQNYTDHESLATAVNLLNIAKAKVLGFFVNDAVSARTGYGYNGYRYKYGRRYGYKYGYKYGYGYGYSDPMPKEASTEKK
ncbi:MAG: CpsD/CapB family tyrosine-protein kinase [Clostridia bacterium]|nr:CpsD/CapB family tyrosine-protein kinase [Clostridia bacterium]